MAWRWVATMALASACVIPTVWTSFDEQSAAEPSLTLKPERQISGADLPQQMSQPPISTRPRARELPELYDIDVVFQDNPFGIAELGALRAHGETLIELPGQAPVTLHLERADTRHGIEHLSANYAGLTSTFTRRGERFYATLATPTESYRLEGDRNGSRLYPQRQLAARTIRHEKDFRHVH